MLNFFFKGLRNAVVEKVFPLSLAVTLSLVDGKAGSRKKLGRMEFELAQAIKARKEFDYINQVEKFESILKSSIEKIKD